MDGTSTMSPPDLHAVMEGNGGGEGFGGGAWWIIILFLFVYTSPKLIQISYP